MIYHAYIPDKYGRVSSKELVFEASSAKSAKEYALIVFGEGVEVYKFRRADEFMVAPWYQRLA